MGVVADPVEVSFAHDVRRKVQLARDAIQDFLDEKHALRPTEAAKRGVGNGVGAADFTHDFKVRE